MYSLLGDLQCRSDLIFEGESRASNGPVVGLHNKPAMVFFIFTVYLFLKPAVL